MAQQIIDVGNVANDGQGDPLRTAFIKTNQNFTELYNAGGVSGIANGTSNITIAEDSTINMAVAGVNDVVVVDSTGLTVNGIATANIISAVGNVYSPYYFGNGSTLTGLNNQNANSLTGTTLSANVVNSSLTNLGTLTVLSVSGNINVAGNVTSNSRVTAANIVSNNSLAVGGNSTFGGGITAGGIISTTANIVANNIIGNIDFASISTPGNVIGANILTSGVVSAAGNVTGNYVLGNGTFLTGIAGAYGNANVAAFLPTYTGALTGANLSLSGGILSDVSTAGNVTGAYYIGNGSQLTGVLATSVGVLPSLSVTGNAVVGNINSAGNATVNSVLAASLSLSGNVLSPILTTQNITTDGTLTANVANVAGQLNMGGNIDMLNQSIVNATSANAITYFGNNLEITDHAYVGTSLTSGTPAGNVIWSSANITATADINANNAVITNNITAGGIISAAGNILTAGVVSAVANVTGGNIITVGLITAGGNVSANNINVSNVANISGNVLANNVLAGGIVSAVGNMIVPNGSFFVGNLIGNITGCIAVPGSNTEVLYNLNGNVGASPSFSFDQSSNILAVGGTIVTDEDISVNGDIAANGIISAAGNITSGTGSFFIGNGSMLTGISATLSNVLASLSVTGNINTGNISAQGNIFGSNLSLSGNVLGSLRSTFPITTTGNVLFGNASVTGNVEASNYFGLSLFLENDISVGNGPGNVIYSLGDITSEGNLVGNNLNVSNVATVTGNITGGNLFTGGVVSATANVTGGNVITGGLVTAQGNVTGSNVTVSTGLLVVASLGADPTGVTGAIYFNTGNSKFRGFDGTNWTNLN